jgi:hypothetical protein
MLTLTDTTAGFTRSTTVANDGNDRDCKSDVTTAAALAGAEADMTIPPIAPEAISAATAAEASMRWR